MRPLLMLALVAGLLATATAQEKKAEEPKKVVPKKAVEKPEPTLKVGDPAPAVKADKWLQGAEVPAFAEGKVYVVEFWATWCGPCIVMMPHMGELQAEFRDQGVTMIGFTSTNEGNNTVEKVADFVRKRGPRLGYTFASQEGRETNDAWMRAAGQNGIPCCFVVDRKGKIAYIGHPMYLDAVLPKVVDGTWTEKDVEALDEIEKEVTAVFRGLSGEPRAGLDTLAAFEKKHPRLAGIPYFNGSRLNAMLKLEKFDEARVVATNLVGKASRQGDPLALQTVSMVMRSPAAAERKDLLAVSVKAAAAQLTVSGENDLNALMNAAASYEAAGDQAKAVEHGRKAVPLAEKELKSDKDYSGLLRVAEAAFVAGDTEKAKSFATKAVEAAPAQVKRLVETRAKKYLPDEPKKDGDEKK